MIRTFGQTNHFLKSWAFIGFSSGDTEIREDLQDYNIIFGCIIPEEMLLGIRRDFFLIVRGYPDVAVCIFYAHCISSFVFYVKKGTKITARELLFSCVAAPEMIQYYLDLGISSENLMRNILAYVSIARPFLLAQERFFYLFQQIGNTDL